MYSKFTAKNYDIKLFTEHNKKKTIHFNMRSESEKLFL